MDAILEEQYFKWLYDHISDDEVGRTTYWKLAKQLHDTEFVYVVANDDNRWVDGRALRGEFRAETDGAPLPLHWLGLACSMLEMLIALSNRLEFQTDEPAKFWFWELLENIGIDTYSDLKYNIKAEEAIAEALDRVIWRRYSYSGEGGLFPLKRADMDQRQLEIWFQMHSYLLEAL